MPRPRTLRTSSKTPKKTFEIPPTLAGGAALVVATLAAIGVSGGALTRAVRNHPIPMAFVVAGMLVAVGVPALFLLRESKLYFRSLLALLLVLVLTVGFGAYSVGQREQPRVALSASTKGKVTTVAIAASGSGLKSAEDMLVQVQGMTKFPDRLPNAESAGCDRSRYFKPKKGEDETSPGHLLLWQQAGPDADGAVEVASNFEVPVGWYEGVCAFVSLRTDPSKYPSIRKLFHFRTRTNYRYVQGYLRLPVQSAE